MNQNGTERWLPVVGHEGSYEVSDQGRVRSMDRLSRYGRSLKGRNLALYRCVYGYLSATLIGEHGPKLVKVHKLVLEAFVGPRPEGMEACHNNGISDDNRVENLRWDTHANNNRDRLTHGTAPWLSVTQCPKGHAYDEANTYVDRKGGRRCRTCHRERVRLQRAA